MLKSFFIWLFVSWGLFSVGQEKNARYQTERGEVSFLADAPLEVIQARSDAFQGHIDGASGTFSFQVAVESFTDFNSPLQKKHFNENYLESDEHPYAVFTGRLLEEIDFEKDGIYQVRAKGSLEIHGVVQERIIPTQLAIQQNKIKVITSFTVELGEHDLQIPKILQQKIATQVTVRVEAHLVKSP